MKAGQTLAEGTTSKTTATAAAAAAAAATTTANNWQRKAIGRRRQAFKLHIPGARSERVSSPSRGGDGKQERKTDRHGHQHRDVYEMRWDEMSDRL